jgi:hypothetical protein
MTKVNFAEVRKRAEAEGLLGAGSYLKLQEGDNRVRLMSECLEHPSEYAGKPTFKWLCYVLDRRDGKIKPFFMANTIYKLIEALQLNPDYGFDEVPMPYDITINAKGAGTKDVVYSVIPARTNAPLTEGELAALQDIQPLRELQKAVYEASGGEQTPEKPADQIQPNIAGRYGTVPPEFLPPGPNTSGGLARPQ